MIAEIRRSRAEADALRKALEDKRFIPIVSESTEPRVDMLDEKPPGKKLRRCRVFLSGQFHMFDYNDCSRHPIDFAPAMQGFAGAEFEGIKLLQDRVFGFREDIGVSSILCCATTKEELLSEERIPVVAKAVYFLEDDDA
jgi:hypothetical protein